MKFLVTWCVHPDKRVEAMSKWSSMSAEERADAGAGVKLIGRWHNVAEYTGAAVLEADDCAALTAYLMQWNPIMDMDVAPVLDDEESAAVGREYLASLGD